MTNKEEKTNKQDETTINLTIIGMESGIDPDTEENKYKVHLAPVMLDKKTYEAVMNKQLANDEDTIKVSLE